MNEANDVPSKEPTMEDVYARINDLLLYMKHVRDQTEAMRFKLEHPFSPTAAEVDAGEKMLEETPKNMIHLFLKKLKSVEGALNAAQSNIEYVSDKLT
jgi:hypothetical protein